MEIQIKDSAIDPDGDANVILYRDSKPNPFYYVHVFLEGRDLIHVEKVRYDLHPSFRNPTTIVEKKYSNQRCKLSIWTWGIFTVTATVYFKSGGKKILRHKLEYDSDFDRAGVSFKKA